MQTEQAIKSSSSDLQAQAWYNLGNAYFDAQQWQQSVEAYKSALRLNPEDSDAKHNLELALQAIRDEQQQDDSNQEEQEQQENQDQGEQEDSVESSSNEEETDEQTTQAPETNETEEQQPAEQAEQTQEMTPEQAQQLLEALLGDSETLQEYLQQYFMAPGAAPEEDW